MMLRSVGGGPPLKAALSFSLFFFFKKIIGSFRILNWKPTNQISHVVDLNFKKIENSLQKPFVYER